MTTEFQNTLTRLQFYLESIDSANPPEVLANDLGSIILKLEELRDSIGGPPPPPPPPPPVDGSRFLDTQLDGKPLPPFPDMRLSSPRGRRYGYTLTNMNRDFGGEHIFGVDSAGLLLQGNCDVSNVTITCSGGDGVKIDGGYGRASVKLRRAFIGGLGMDPGAHADVLQARGNVEYLLMDGVYAYIPLSIPGTLSNACLIMDNAQGSNGHTDIRNCIFYGGNRCLMVTDKGSHEDLGTYAFSDTAFIVDASSPQYTLLQPGLESRYSFDETCGVYALGADGICRLLTRDVLGFDLQAWRG